jgi:GNAT superfamily N-acetyltransferase
MTAIGDAAARAAVVADLERIVDLARQARAELVGERGGALWAVREARPEPLLAGFAQALESDESLLVVGTFDAAVVGYALASLETLRDGGRLAVLSDVYVDPQARGVGVGEAIMDGVVAWCTAHGCRGLDSLALPGMRESKNFFERFGLKARQLVVHRSFDASAVSEDE